MKFLVKVLFQQRSSLVPVLTEIYKKKVQYCETQASYSPICMYITYTKRYVSETRR